MNNTKSNFTVDQIQKFFNLFNKGFEVRMNKYGNLELINKINPKGKGEYYVLHAYNSGKFLWRRHYTTFWGSESMCPLNMKNRNILNRYGNWYYWDYNNCKFNSFEDAMNYIKMYFKKYRNIKLN